MKINERISTVVGSTTLTITARAKELKVQGCDVVNFAAGEPDFDTPDFIKQAAVKAIDAGMTKYTPSVGTLELREAICQKLKNDNSLDYKPTQVAVTCGAKHALFSAINILIDKGDDVLIPAPYWVSYPEMVKIAGGNIVFLPTTAETNFKINAAQLNQSITKKTKLLILNSPSNPTGMLYTKSELEAIAEICVKNSIVVISDEIYEKLIYDTSEYTSIASLGKDIYDLTLTINGVSKAYSMTGWRIGYIAGPQSVLDYVKKLQDHSTSNPSSISQAAALAALKAPEDALVSMREQFKARRDLLMSGMDSIPKIKYIRPEGAFYLFCDVSAYGEAMDVAKSILDQKHVALIPGEGFGAPGYVRMSFATSEERIQEGVKRIFDWVSKKA